LKFPDRYAANIKWTVNVGIGKLNGLKSHDYHIIIERLLSVMLRGYLDTDSWQIKDAEAWDSLSEYWVSPAFVAMSERA
jgi:hypothetical protein